MKTRKMATSFRLELHAGDTLLHATQELTISKTCAHLPPCSIAWRYEGTVERVRVSWQQVPSRTQIASHTNLDYLSGRTRRSQRCWSEHWSLWSHSKRLRQEQVRTRSMGWGYTIVCKTGHVTGKWSRGKGQLELSHRSTWTWKEIMHQTDRQLCWAMNGWRARTTEDS